MHPYNLHLIAKVLDERAKPSDIEALTDNGLFADEQLTEAGMEAWREAPDLIELDRSDSVGRGTLIEIWIKGDWTGAAEVRQEISWRDGTWAPPEVNFGARGSQRHGDARLHGQAILRACALADELNAVTGLAAPAEED